MLDPQFEADMYRYENWQISSDWAQMFPHLISLVNVEEKFDSSGVILKEP